ncbi:MAG TPA: hypothetical protein VMZ28_07315, partial [Kofleriaceae bacterium]|nr:hypothetical protein [Kofleriaceae bacterium]
MKSYLAYLGAALLALGGCKKDDLTDPMVADADPTPTDDLEPPELSTIPSSTPLTTVALKGSTEGSRIVTQGAASGTIVTVVLPGGSFCQDAPISTEEPTELKVYAMTGDGRISDPSTIEVTYDSGAPEPEPPTCGASDCVPADEEICGNGGTDDDCNGWGDICDLSCSGCTDDIYEPNDLPVNVPSLTADTYNLHLCQCRDDWWAFNRGPGDNVQALATFLTSNIDIDLDLYLSGPDGAGVIEPPVASSHG